MALAAVRRLPLLVQAGGLVGRFGSFQGQFISTMVTRRARLAVSLLRERIQSAEPYRSASGFALQIDAADYFQACMMLGLFEPLSVALVRRYARPGTVAIDGGGHIGYLALHLARAVGPTGAVHTFECDPRLSQRVRDHVALNGLGNVSVVERALLDRTGEMIDLQMTDQLGWSTVEPGHLQDVRNVLAVETVRLDDYLDAAGVAGPQLSFIKLDVEGAERSALEGMDRTLHATRAPVMVEVIAERMQKTGHDPAELLEFMAGHGYCPWVPAAASRLSASRVKLLPARLGAPFSDLLFLKSPDQQC